MNEEQLKAEYDNLKKQLAELAIKREKEKFEKAFPKGELPLPFELTFKATSYGPTHCWKEKATKICLGHTIGLENGVELYTKGLNMIMLKLPEYYVKRRQDSGQLIVEGKFVITSIRYEEGPSFASCVQSGEKKEEP